MKNKIFFSLFLLNLTLWTSQSQAMLGSPFEPEGIATSDDLGFSGDIFSDFNEEIEASKVLEDERFYRYGRFFSANFGLGTTTFMGNRGRAYETFPPSYNLSVVYFFDFQLAFTMGVQFSKHAMYIDTPVNAYRNRPIGTIEVNMIRPFFGFRYYIDTSDLGTAITYANPYITARFEYWYQSNKFINAPDLDPQSGGGIGSGVGFGLEFPIEMKESYLGVEFLFHQANFFDKFSQDYAPIPPGDPEGRTSDFGYEDLTGNAFSVMISYNLTW